MSSLFKQIGNACLRRCGIEHCSGDSRTPTDRWSQRDEATIRTKLLNVTRHDNSLRVPGRRFCVSARKIGLALSGSTIGNNALTTRKKTFIASRIY